MKGLQSGSLMRHSNRLSGPSPSHGDQTARPFHCARHCRRGRRGAGAAQRRCCQGAQELIDKPVCQANAGSPRIHDAGAAIDQLFDSLRHVTASVAWISRVSQKQIASIVEIDVAVGRMAQATQQKAALAAQSLQPLGDAVAASSSRRRRCASGTEAGVIRNQTRP